MSQVLWRAPGMLFLEKLSIILIIIVMNSEARFTSLSCTSIKEIIVKTNWSNPTNADRFCGYGSIWQDLGENYY